MKRLAVFCGSSYGASQAYKDGAIQLGKELARRGITLVMAVVDSDPERLIEKFCAYEPPEIKTFVKK